MEQRGRFTVVQDEVDESGGGGGGGGGVTRQMSVQKGRFTVMDDGDGGHGSGDKPAGGGGGVKESKIVGASEPVPGAVAAAAEAAAAAERDLDPPRLKVRGMYEAMEAAAEHAKVLRTMHEHMEEQQEKITSLVDDNRWLRRRVKELEARLG